MKANAPFIFVLMPFDPSFDDIYKLGIKACCMELGSYCERVDEQIFEENILDRIYNQINKADIIIADMTGKNSNVFYETGYAHALNKRVILLTQRVDDIPFDLRHHHHIVYDGKIIKLQEELRKRLDWFLSNPSQTPLSISGIEIYMEGLKLSNREATVFKKSFDLIRGGFYSTSVKVKLDVFNNSNKPLDSAIKLGVVTKINEGFLPEHEPSKRIRIDENQLLYTLEEITSLYPNAWDSCDFKLSSSKYKDGLNQQHEGKYELPFTIKMFSEFGTQDFPVIYEFT